MNRSPYAFDWKYERERVIYGLVLNQKTGKHYCFNRDYFVLPVQLPNEVIKLITSIAEKDNGTGATAHGKFMPDDIGNEEDCRIYYLFSDRTAPSWNTETYHYDKKIYE